MGTKTSIRQIAFAVVPRAVRAASLADVGGSYSSTGGAEGTGRLTSMANSLDGVSLANNDRLLLKNQTDPKQNGIYYVQAVGAGSNGTWDRAIDFDSDEEALAGTQVFITEGTQASQTWQLTGAGTLTLNSSSLVFAQFGAGSSGSSMVIPPEVLVPGPFFSNLPQPAPVPAAWMAQ